MEVDRLIEAWRERLRRAGLDRGQSEMSKIIAPPSM